MSTTILALAAVLFPGLADAATGYPRQDLLVEPQQLKEFLSTKHAVLLDTRGKGQYLDGHIPGARWLNAITWGREFKDGADEAGWATKIGALGIDTSTPVIVYGDKLNEAARAWWILRYWGVEDVRLLNGGWKGWTALAEKVEKGDSKPTAIAATLRPRRNRLATKAELLALLKGPPIQIVDARSAEEHCGKAETARRNGAIPGARNLEWTEAIDLTTGRFKAPGELAKLIRTAGIDPTKPVVAHCQSGGRSSVTVFTLELMGVKDARNYYRSWAEWGNAEDTPIVKP